VAHFNRLICRDLIQIVHVLENAHLPLRGGDKLEVFEYLHDHLSLHDTDRLFISQLTAQEKIGLTELVQSRIKWQTLINVLLVRGQIGESLHRVLKEKFIIIGDFEVLDELGDGEDLKHVVLIHAHLLSRETTVLRPIDRLIFVFIKVICKLTAEAEENVIELGIHAAVLIDVFQNMPCLSQGLLDQFKLLHFVDFFGVRLLITTGQVVILSFVLRISACCTLAFSFCGFQATKIVTIIALAFAFLLAIFGLD